MKTKYTYIAIDAAKAAHQVQTPSESFKITNNPSGFTQLFQRIAPYEHPLLVCESSGGYERDLLAEAFARDIPVRRVHAGRVRAFAQSEGIRAKTDPLDAKLIWKFAEQKQLQPMDKPDPAQEQLACWVNRRLQLVDLLRMEKNHQENCPKAVARSIAANIRHLEKEIEKVNATIRELIEANARMRKRASVMLAVVGVGEVLVWTLLAYLGELGQLRRNEIVTMVGLAPFNRDTGTSSGKRKIQGGRFKIRRVLYMATQSAAQHNAVIKAYVAGLLARGKPYKCAIVAAMRKMIIHLHTLIKKSEQLSQNPA